MQRGKYSKRRAVDTGTDQGGPSGDQDDDGKKDGDPMNAPTNRSPSNVVSRLPGEQSNANKRARRDMVPPPELKVDAVDGATKPTSEPDDSDLEPAPDQCKQSPSTCTPVITDPDAHTEYLIDTGRILLSESTAISSDRASTPDKPYRDTAQSVVQLRDTSQSVSDTAGDPRQFVKNSAGEFAVSGLDPIHRRWRGWVPETVHAEEDQQDDKGSSSEKGSTEDDSGDSDDIEKGEINKECLNRAVPGFQGGQMSSFSASSGSSQAADAGLQKKRDIKSRELAQKGDLSKVLSPGASSLDPGHGPLARSPPVQKKARTTVPVTQSRQQVVEREIRDVNAGASHTGQTRALSNVENSHDKAIDDQKKIKYYSGAVLRMDDYEKRIISEQIEEAEAIVSPTTGLLIPEGQLDVIGLIADARKSPMPSGGNLLSLLTNITHSGFARNGRLVARDALGNEVPSDSGEAVQLTWSTYSYGVTASYDLELRKKMKFRSDVIIALRTPILTYPLIVEEYEGPDHHKRVPLPASSSDYKQVGKIMQAYGMPSKVSKLIRSRCLRSGSICATQFEYLFMIAGKTTMDLMAARAQGSNVEGLLTRHGWRYSDQNIAFADFDPDTEPDCGKFSEWLKSGLELLWINSKIELYFLAAIDRWRGSGYYLIHSVDDGPNKRWHRRSSDIAFKTLDLWVGFSAIWRDMAEVERALAAVRKDVVHNPCLIIQSCIMIARKYGVAHQLMAALTRVAGLTHGPWLPLDEDETGAHRSARYIAASQGYEMGRISAPFLNLPTIHFPVGLIHTAADASLADSSDPVSSVRPQNPSNESSDFLQRHRKAETELNELNGILRQHWKSDLEPCRLLWSICSATRMSHAVITWRLGIDCSVFQSLYGAFDTSNLMLAQQYLQPHHEVGDGKVSLLNLATWHLLLKLTGIAWPAAYVPQMPCMANYFPENILHRLVSEGVYNFGNQKLVYGLINKLLVIPDNVPYSLQKVYGSLCSSVYVPPMGRGGNFEFRCSEIVEQSWILQNLKVKNTLVYMYLINELTLVVTVLIYAARTQLAEMNDIHVRALPLNVNGLVTDSGLGWQDPSLRPYLNGETIMELVKWEVFWLSEWIQEELKRHDIVPPDVTPDFLRWRWDRATNSVDLNYARMRDDDASRLYFPILDLSDARCLHWGMINWLGSGHMGHPKAGDTSFPVDWFRYTPTWETPDSL